MGEWLIITVTVSSAQSVVYQVVNDGLMEILAHKFDWLPADGGNQSALATELYIDKFYFSRIGD